MPKTPLVMPMQRLIVWLRPWGRTAISVACGCLVLSGIGGQGAFAQSSNVFVDNSVIESLGRQQTSADMLLPMNARPLSQQPGAARAQGSRVNQGGAMPPPRTAPRSQLLVAPVGGVAAPPRNSVAAAPPQRSKPPAQQAKRPTPHYTPAVTVTAPAPPEKAAPVLAAAPPVKAAEPEPIQQSMAPVVPSAPVVSAPAPSPALPDITPPTVALRGDDAKVTPKDPVAAAAMAAAAARANNPAPPTAPPVTTALASVAPKQQKVAPSAASALPTGEGLTVPFAGDDATIPAQSNASLERLVQQLTQDPSLTARIEAYAAGGEASVSKARRLSLSRALAVRSFLLDRGIAATRIEVRALGTPTRGTPDRVDVGIIKS